MSNTITLEFSAEDRARLDKLQESLTQLDATLTAASGVFSIRNLPQATQDNAQPQAKTEPAKVPTQAQDAAESRTEAAAGTAYKLTDVQQLVTALCSPERGLKAQVREIVKSYAARVPDIPEAKWPEVMTKLKALENGDDSPF